MTQAPATFIGHGSPMHALGKNDYTESLARLRKEWAEARAIVCVSAHWLTSGTWVTGMASPKTIHDFSGFPKPLYEIEYRAPGDPELAKNIVRLVDVTKVRIDDQDWGFDHGCWAPLLHVLPEALTPVVQLSLDIKQPPSFHFELGQQLRPLRDEGVVIVGSGNVVHNLRMLNWDTQAEPFKWASEFDGLVKKHLLARDFQGLITAHLDSPAGKLSVPTVEHYYPLLYVLGASNHDDQLDFHYETIEHGSIAMRTFSFIKS